MANRRVTTAVKASLDAIDIHGCEQYLEINISGLGPMAGSHAQLFVRFLQEHPNAVDSLTIRCGEVSPQAVDIIREYLRTTTTLRELNLDAKLGNVKLEHLLSGLYDNTSVTHLSLWFTIGEGAACGEIITKLLQHKPDLKELQLWGVELRGEGANTLQPGIQSSLLELLDLRDAGLGDDGVSLIVDALCESKAVEHLNLEENNLTPHGLSHLIRLLQVDQSSLCTLNLKYNPELFDDELQTRLFSITFAQHQKLSTLALTWNRLPPHAIVALRQAVANSKTLTRFDVYTWDNSGCGDGHDYQGLLTILPCSRVKLLNASVDFTHPSFVSAFFRNTTIQHLCSEEEDESELTDESQVTDGPAFSIVERNRWIGKSSSPTWRNPIAWCHSNPSTCAKHLFELPPVGACLHTLLEEERNEVDTIMNVIHNCCQSGGGLAFWSSAGPFLNERMVRFLFFLAIKVSVDSKQQADIYFFEMLLVYGMIKCGSAAATWQAMTGDASLPNDTESQESFAFLCRALKDVWQQHDSLGLVHILSELAPCNCLRKEIHQVQQEVAQRDGEPMNLLLLCSNDNCESEEKHPFEFHGCAACKASVYCSKPCQKHHWKGHGMEASPTAPHKKACKAIQELKSLLAAGRS